MNDLLNTLKNTNQASRINAIEKSYQGDGTAQSNHVVKWKGYDTNGRSLVEANGKIYAAKNLGKTTPKADQTVLLRTGKGIKVIAY